MDKTVRISEDTISILKNFATIQKNLAIDPGTGDGTRLRTWGENRDVVAFANIAETIPAEMNIYDLNQFISLLTTFKNPTLDVSNSTYVLIRSEDGKSKTKFFYAERDLLSIPKSYSVKFPDPFLTFTMSQKDLQQLTKFAGILGVPDLQVTTEDGNIIMRVYDKDNSKVSSFDINMGEYSGTATFDIHMKTDKLKFMAGDYQVSFVEKGLSRFVSDSVEYYVAIEQTSNIQAAAAA
jgi:hypothetical protein